MNKVTCSNGHFFDLDRFTMCPVCGEPPVAAAQSDAQSGTAASPVYPSPGKPVAPALEPTLPLPYSEPEEEEVPSPETTPEQPQADPVQQPQQELSQAIANTGSGAISSLPKTRSLYDCAQTEPPTGWLVCIRGVYQCRAFALKAGRNRIGRNPTCDITLVDDDSITREPHAVIIYDPTTRCFHLQNGSGDGLVHCNGTLLFDHQELSAYDRIRMGSAEFLFVPLCGSQFTWDSVLNGGA